MSASPRRTALHAAHKAAGAKFVPFAGWEMPVQYSSILEENRAVRERAGVFDISHMGEFFVSGPGARKWLNWQLTNDLETLEVGQGQYSLLLHERGGVIDDLIVYRIGPERYFLVVNAATIEQDFDWIHEALADDAVLENESDEFSGVALQGPRALDTYRAALPKAPVPARFNLGAFRFDGIEAFVARTGYTGEDGVEIFVPNSHAERLWDAIVNAGATPCGLGARDSLRLEVCYPLNGSDMTADTTPLEAGLGFAVAIDKAGGFTGQGTLRRQKAAGLRRRLMAFVAADGPPPRAHYQLFDGDARVGEVTSGGFSPALRKGIGMGYVDAPSAKVGRRLEMEVRGKRVPVVISKKPLYNCTSLSCL